MTNLDYYLLKDHRARQRTTLVSVGLAVFLAIFVHAAGLTLSDTAVVCVVAACAVEFVRALLYKQPSAKEAKNVVPVMSLRGALLRAALAILVISAAVGLTIHLSTPITVRAALDSAQQEAKAGNIDNANKRVEEVSRKLARLKFERAAAPEDFFASAAHSLNQLPSAGVPSESVHGALVQLAEYRAGINEGRANTAYLGQETLIGGFLFVKNSVLVGPNVAINHGSGKGFDLGETILDNVTFQNETVLYDGSRPLKLTNVRFINCRFLVISSPQGDQLLTAMAEPVVNVQIGEIPPEILKRVYSPDYWK